MRQFQCGISHAANVQQHDSFVNIFMSFVLVKTSGDYWVGKYEVRQKEFETVMGYNPSKSKDPHQPVECVSSEEALEFCQKLTGLEVDQLSGYEYSLPTESMWRSFVADAELQNAIIPRNKKYSHAARVGTLGPNRLGLTMFEVMLPNSVSSGMTRAGTGE